MYFCFIVRQTFYYSRPVRQVVCAMLKQLSWMGEYFAIVSMKLSSASISLSIAKFFINTSFAVLKSLKSP